MCHCNTFQTGELGSRVNRQCNEVYLKFQKIKNRIKGKKHHSLVIPNRKTKFFI